MNAKFISHPDFANLLPNNDVFHKEIPNDSKRNTYNEPHPEELLNRHIIYIKKAELPEFKSAILNITADDHYKLYINGKFVTEGPAPSFPHAYYYTELDVTEYLTKGENKIAVHTYYQGLVNRAWVSGDRRQMLWCSLVLDGETVLVSDESWKCKYHTGYAEMGRIGYDTAFAERIDAASPDTYFYAQDFDDSDFIYAKENAHGDWKLVKQTTKQLDIYEISPETCEKTEYGLKISLPSEMIGSLIIKAQGNKGDTILARYGEELFDDGSLRYDTRANCKYEEEFILSGGADRLENYDYKAFRYAELRFPKSVTVESVKMLVRHYPFDKKCVYKTENEKLKRVLWLCENTVKYATQERYLDCPSREKGAYLGDLMVSGRAHAVITGDTSLIKHAVIDFCNTSFITPGLLACACGSLMQEIADYSLEFPAVLNWIYSLDGDIEFLKRCEPYATGVYEYYKKYENADGLLDEVYEWNLIDWPANLRDNYDFPGFRPTQKGVHNVMNALWYGLKIALGELYSTLGISRDVGAEKTKSSFISAFYSSELDLFTDTPNTQHSAVHSNIFPLLFGIGTENENTKRNIISLIREKRLTSMGVYMAYFTLAALKENGEYALCEELATDEGAWLNMLAEGATTTFEAWGKEQKWNTSFCHPWATAPAIIFADVRPY
jgi:hypothetical protein